MAIVSCTLETRPKRSEADWAAVDAMTDADIDFSDIPRLTDIPGLRRRVKQAVHHDIEVIACESPKLLAV